LLTLAGSSAESKYLTKSLQICDQGSFFVGGVPKTTHYSGNVNPSTNPAQITVGQMYVQFQIPQSSLTWPIIHVHGSTHSGAALEATPHGTEGWGPYTVRNKLATYVVDQPGRGRSGNDNSRIHEAASALMLNPAADPTTTIPNIGRITDNGSYTAWFGHLVQPGTATNCTNILTCELMPHGWRPDDPSNVNVHPSPAGYLPAWAFHTAEHIYPDNLNLANTGTWGPAPFGPADAYKQHYYRQLLPNYEATLPGSTCLACNPQAKSPANTWSPRNLAALVEMLGGAIVATHSQSGSQGHDMVRILRDRGNLHLLKGLITFEGSCSLTNAGLLAADFDNVPYLAFKGDYTVPSAQCIATVAEINARRALGLGTAKADYIQADDPIYGGQFNGVTHMGMLDTKNLEFLDLVLDWASTHIKNPHSKGPCNSPPPPA
jgi:hypothetical protein